MRVEISYFEAKTLDGNQRLFISSPFLSLPKGTKDCQSQRPGKLVNNKETVPITGAKWQYR